MKPTPVRCLFPLGLMLSFALGAAGSLRAEAEFRPWGNLAGLRLAGQLVPFETSVRVVRADWSGFTQSSKYNWEGRQTYEIHDGVQLARHAVMGLPVDYAVTCRDEGDGGCEVKVQVDLRDRVEAAGIYFCLRIPAADFPDVRWAPVGAEGGDGPAPAAANGAPASFRARGILVMAGATTIACAGPQPATLLVRRDVLDHPPELNDPHPRLDFVAPPPGSRAGDLQVYFPLVTEGLAPGAHVERVFHLQAAATVEHAPADVWVDPAHPGPPFEGIGGNFRLQFPESDPAVIAYCLDHLRVTWGRIAMYWREWHPRAGDDPLARARAGQLSPLLDRQMSLARQLHERGLKVIVSVWDPPRWAADPWPNGERGEALKDDQLEKSAASVGDYLVLLREKYGVEADLFSFNETDVGVEVRETPAMHALHARVFRQAFAARGLRTRMLLADTGHGTALASRILDQVRVDPVARAAGGAVAFHTYHGCTPTDLAAWTQAGRELDLPLYVTEVGPDSAAHRYPLVFLQPWFARQEIDLYLRIAAACQPQMVMPWQLTADYSVLIGQGLYGDTGPLRPTQRFWGLKHLADMPAGALWLPVRAGRPDLTVAAWQAAGTVAGLHLLNNGASREVVVHGLPKGITSLAVRTTSATEGYAALPEVAVHDGVARIVVPAGALISLSSAR